MNCEQCPYSYYGAAIPTSFTYDDEQAAYPAAIMSPIITNNPPTANISFFKELTGYPNYGNPSGNADILYTGSRGAWTFNNVPFYLAPGAATIVIRAVLDDHTNVPVNRYSARISVNGIVVHNGAVPLQHGTPVGGRFTNWTNLTFNVRNIRPNNRIEIVNTSTAADNDWIGLDWMELRLGARRRQTE